VRCRVCDSNRLLRVLDLGATPPCEKLLTVDELDLPEPTIPRLPVLTTGFEHRACVTGSLVDVLVSPFERG
jgi:hypothetical protein